MYMGRIKMEEMRAMLYLTLIDNKDKTTFFEQIYTHKF